MAKSRLWVPAMMLGAPLAWLAFVGAPQTHTRAPSKGTSTYVKPNPVDGLKLERFSWRMVGSVAVLDSITIKSTNATPTKDIKFACLTYSKSDTALSSKGATLYDVLPANGTKTFRPDLNLGFVNQQSAKMDCHLISAEAGR